MSKSRKAHKTPKTAASEKEFRTALLSRARLLGCEGDLKIIFEKYDKALKSCTNDIEYRHISECGIAEIHKLFDCTGGLTVDGKMVLPPEPSFSNKSKIIKL